MGRSKLWDAESCGTLKAVALKAVAESCGENCGAELKLEAVALQAAPPSL